MSCLPGWLQHELLRHAVQLTRHRGTVAGAEQPISWSWASCISGYISRCIACCISRYVTRYITPCVSLVTWYFLAVLVTVENSVLNIEIYIKLYITLCNRICIRNDLWFFGMDAPGMVGDWLYNLIYTVLYIQLNNRICNQLCNSICIRNDLYFSMTQIRVGVKLGIYRVV